MAASESRIKAVVDALETRIVDMHPSSATSHRRTVAPSPVMAEHASRNQGARIMPPDTLTIIGSVIGTGLAVGISLAVLILRSTSRLDADRREVQRRFDTAMDTFRTEVQRLAER